MSTRNRLHNVSNPYQGGTKKVLCVCSAGLLRSPTLANVLHQEYGYNTRAAGCDIEYALIPFDDVLAAWADQIVCVDRGVANMVLAYLNKWDMAGEVVVLAVPDQYAWNNPDLKKLLLKQYADSSIMKEAQNEQPSK